jgi:hypothetical protein
MIYSNQLNNKTRLEMTESALAAIEVALIIKTKVYRSLNMGVLQGGRAIPVGDLHPPSFEN